MTNPACSTPGCLFESAGKAGLCTDSVGTLSNAEIARQIKTRGLTPTHYKDAAVKVITWDDQWVAYDDPDTYQQKSDFARSMCLGGVMVWALSMFQLSGFFIITSTSKSHVLQKLIRYRNLGQDSDDHASSGALATSTGRSAMFVQKALGSDPEGFQTITQTMTNRQCRWQVSYPDLVSINAFNASEYILTFLQ